MPPQFSDYLQYGQQSVRTAFNDPKHYNTGWFWSDDYNKTAFDIANAEYQNQFNAYQAELAFNREKELINAQNEYNSPANQIARYQAAGLNPSLIYGQITPGLQTGVANYQPQKAAEVKNSLPGTTEKLGRAMSVISTIGNMLSNAAGIAGQIEGVKNQNLQNQILETQLPAVQWQSAWQSLLNQNRFQFYHNSGEFQKLNISDLGDFGKILFPDYYKGELSESRTDYQKWWNEQIAPIYKQLQEGKASQAETDAEIKKYNDQMLESMPPALRPYFGLVMEFLRVWAKPGR